MKRKKKFNRNLWAQAGSASLIGFGCFALGLCRCGLFVDALVIALGQTVDDRHHEIDNHRKHKILEQFRYQIL